jgi:hypothetical protein
MGSFSETHDPIMVLPSAARRGRGHGVRADVNTGTQNAMYGWRNRRG